MNRLFRFASFIALLALGSPALAQNAQINGTVKDETGGTLPGVTVLVKNKESGLVRTVVTDGAGTYRVGALRPALYSITTQLSGFRSEAREIQLVIDQSATIPFVLKPASLTETVDVTAEAPLVDTSISTV